MEDHRFIVARREARLSVALALAYGFFWAACAYLPSDTTLGITGFPLWFELSCLVIPVVFIVSAVLMVKYLFTDVPLDAGARDNNSESNSDNNTKSNTKDACHEH